MANPPKLQVINDGKPDGVRIGSVLVSCGNSEMKSAYPVDAQVIEEDTWQVLSADPALREVHEHPIRLMIDLINQDPLSIGDVVMQGECWQAVIYDFDQEPICKQEWVESVLQRILANAEEKQVNAISLPLLGSIHGCLSWDDSLAMIVAWLQQVPLKSLQTIWLEVPDEYLHDTQQRLQQVADSAG